MRHSQVQLLAHWIVGGKVQAMESIKKGAEFLICLPVHFQLVAGAQHGAAKWPRASAREGRAFLCSSGAATRANRSLFMSSLLDNVNFGPELILAGPVCCHTRLTASRSRERKLKSSRREAIVSSSLLRTPGPLRDSSRLSAGQT